MCNIRGNNLVSISQVKAGYQAAYPTLDTRYWAAYPTLATRCQAAYPTLAAPLDTNIEGHSLFTINSHHHNQE